ncbi:MAG: phospho-N-acetylmuramoyl-pentapeptide-transferase [Clostridia bacterium]|nr:phospho-N-acetylmuramoyl-pentapeptide-transferase [Clostridia bacterium]
MNYFQIKILLLSFIVTVILGTIIIPLLKRRKVGQIEREDGPESHLTKQGTPTMGGIIIAVAIMILVVFIFFSYAKEDIELAKKLIPMSIITVGFGIIGLIDDAKKLLLKNTKGLKPAYKILGLLTIAVIYVIYIVKGVNLGTDTYIPIIKIFINLPLWIYVPFAIFVILGTTNAINLTDGVDGLCPTVSTIIITCLTVIGIIFDVKEVVIFGTIVIGVVLGFLLFNMHPAKVFMGDTGSLLLGGVISAIALYLKMPLILIIIAIIPVLETISVMMQVIYFKKTGNRIFKMAPLHHHFELSGWGENKVVSIFSLITLVLCIIGLIVI